MKKIALLILCLTMITSLISCNSSNNEERTMPTNNTNTTQMITGAVSITGKVTEIYGNEVTIRLAEGNSSTSNTERPNRTEGVGAEGEGSMGTGENTTERPDMSNMTEEEIQAMKESAGNRTQVEGDTDEDKSAMRENMTQGGRGQTQTQEQEIILEEDDEEDDDSTLTSAKSTQSTNIGAGFNVMSIGISNTSIILNGGGPSGDRTSMSDSDRQSMMESMGGDRTSMSSGNNSTTSVDEIVLTDSTAEYTIPVGVPVYSYGTALSFSQISKDAYITIYMNNEGNIVSVNILS